MRVLLTLIRLTIYFSFSFRIADSIAVETVIEAVKLQIDLGERSFIEDFLKLELNK